MSRRPSDTETEIKLRLRDAAHGRRLLRASGFHLIHRRIFESNVLYDTPSGDLRNQGVLLRLRQAGANSVLAYKGPATARTHKSREEIETHVSDPLKLQEILERIGFLPVFRYEKYRAEYEDSTQSGLAMLDETPVGTFLELEGSPSWIDRTARRLGFSETDYITRSYATIYFEDCKVRGVRPTNMQFNDTSTAGRATVARTR